MWAVRKDIEMRNSLRAFSVRACIALSVLAVAVTAAAQTKTVSQEATKGTPSVKTQQLNGTVVEVAGDQLIVKLASGELRMFTPPADRRFQVDGRELTLSQLQPGTKLKATYTETTTPVTVRTVESLAGKVFYVAAPTVILTLENGENKMYTVRSNDPVKFRHSSGQEMTVFDLRKDMRINATKITEAPKTELSSTTVVTGTLPVVAAAPVAAAPAVSAATAGAAPAPPVEAANTAPARLPKTASPVPSAGLLGLLLAAAGFGIRAYRQR
jgi:hypothetical protein